MYPQQVSLHVPLKTLAQIYFWSRHLQIIAILAFLISSCAAIKHEQGISFYSAIVVGLMWQGKLNV